MRMHFEANTYKLMKSIIWTYRVDATNISCEVQIYLLNLRESIVCYFFFLQVSAFFRLEHRPDVYWRRNIKICISYCLTVRLNFWRLYKHFIAVISLVLFYSTEFIMWKSLFSVDEDRTEMNHNAQNIIYSLYNSIGYFTCLWAWVWVSD